MQWQDSLLAVLRWDEIGNLILTSIVSSHSLSGLVSGLTKRIHEPSTRIQSRSAEDGLESDSS